MVNAKSANNISQSIKNRLIDVKNAFAESFANAITKRREQAINDAVEDAYAEGKKNTVAALYDIIPNDDKRIIQALKDYWEMSEEDAEWYLINEKRDATIRALQKYLKLQGYPKKYIDDFIDDKRILIRKNVELWKLKDNPHKLYNILKK